MSNGEWIGETFLHQRRGESQIRFAWQGTKCGIDLKNLRQDDGHVYADVHVYVDKRRHLVRPKVNVTSDRSLPSLRKAIVEATEVVDGEGNRRPPCDWGVFLDSMVAVLVDEMDQKGEMTWLTPLEGQDLAQPMLFRNFVPQGLLSGIVAHGGTGKSLTALLMTLAIATGRRIGPFEPNLRGKVLYADWENQWELHARRMTRICHGLGIDFPVGMIGHYRARGKLVQAEAELVEMAVENNVVLTLFDSIGFASGGNLNDSDVATSAVNAIKHIPGTKVMIAHVTKASVETSTSKAPSGSAFFWNGPQAVYDLQASEPDADGSIVLSIYQSKANVGSKLKRPLGVKVEFADDDHGGPITPNEFLIEGHLVGGEGLPEKTRVIDYLKSCNGMPVDAQTITEALYEDPDRGRVDGVASTLRKLRSAGVVESVGESSGGRGKQGSWVLKHAQPALSTGTVDDSDPRCARCGSLVVACFDANYTPLCAAHRDTGVW